MFQNRYINFESTFKTSLMQDYYKIVVAEIPQLLIVFTRRLNRKYFVLLLHYSRMILFSTNANTTSAFTGLIICIPVNLPNAGSTP